MSDSRKELETVLWAGADVLRSKMDANEYKDYLLSFVFYKYLSDTFLVRVYDLLEDCVPESMEQAQQAYEEAYQEEDAADLLADLKESCRYIIEPHLTFTALAKKANNNEFNREELKKAFNDIETSDPIFNDLFADVDLYSSRLGVGDTKQSATVAELVKVIDQADVLHAEGDVLGNAYEYLIGEFASETGKKAGEFYTPAGPAEIVTRIAISGQEDKQGLLVYDPCMGSASMLLDARKFSTRPEYVKYFGQELMMSTYNLARMNMFLHGIAPENQHLRNGDTLDADWPTTEETEFDMVVMNPPYSANWNAKKGFLSDSRFSDYGVLAPKSKADYAFLLHGFYHLKPTGTMAIVLPHGVLFRGGSEGTIRQKLLENGSIYAIIGLPANMFYNTDIPTCIVVLKKQRPGRDVLFIDASKYFEKRKTQNIMTAEHIEHVMDLYTKRQSVEKEAFLASFDKIKENGYNLNLPRYVDTFEDEEQIDLAEVNRDIREIDVKISEVEEHLLTMLESLQSEDEMTMHSLRLFSDKNGNNNLVGAIAESGIVGKLFPRKGETKPRLRFAGFSGDWKERKFSEFTWAAGKRNKDNLDLVAYAITNEHGFIPQNEAHDEFGYMKDTDRSAYMVVSPNSFGYNPARINVGSFGYYNGTERVIVSSLYEIFQTAEDVDDGFILHWFNTVEFRHWIERLQEGSVRLYFYYDKLCECHLKMPELDEQQRIAQFLNEVDYLISLEKKRVEAMINLKQFMLQNLFPQEG